MRHRPLRSRYRGPVRGGFQIKPLHFVHCVFLHSPNLLNLRFKAGLIATNGIAASSAALPIPRTRQGGLSDKTTALHALRFLHSPSLLNLRFKAGLMQKTISARKWFCLSGKWGSNPRPSAWEADALPLSYCRVYRSSAWDPPAGGLPLSYCRRCGFQKMVLKFD